MTWWFHATLCILISSFWQTSKNSYFQVTASGTLIVISKQTSWYCRNWGPPIATQQSLTLLSSATLLTLYVPLKTSATGWPISKVAYNVFSCHYYMLAVISLLEACSGSLFCIFMFPDRTMFTVHPLLPSQVLLIWFLYHCNIIMI